MAEDIRQDLEKLTRSEEALLAAPLPPVENHAQNWNLEEELEKCRAEGDRLVSELLKRFADGPAQPGEEESDFLREVSEQRKRQRALFLQRLEQVAEKLRNLQKEKLALQGYRPGKKEEARFVDKKS